MIKKSRQLYIYSMMFVYDNIIITRIQDNSNDKINDNNNSSSKYDKKSQYKEY